jgi:hypothetical protein
MGEAGWRIAVPRRTEHWRVMSEVRRRWGRRSTAMHEALAWSPGDPETWAAAGEEISSDDKLWRQYTVLVDLYRYYIDLMWKVCAWAYTAIGASLIYVVEQLNARSTGYVTLLLLFLALMSGGLSVILAACVPRLKEMEGWLSYIRNEHSLPGFPHVSFVRAGFRLNSTLLLLISMACIAFYIYVAVSFDGR